MSSSSRGRMNSASSSRGISGIWFCITILCSIGVLVNSVVIVVYGVVEYDCFYLK